MPILVRKNVSYLIFAVVLAAILFGVLRFFLVPYLFRITPDFRYSADLISLDNFYDEKTRSFSGEARSVTNFEYKVGEIKNGKVDLNGIYEVRTVSGEKIIDISRKYGIDQYAWTHVAGMGDQNRQGFLFGPRNFSKVSNFNYWHINYNQPIQMVFSGEEVIDGVKTYRYSSDFSADQTNDLDDLPGVPEERGVNLDASLSLWIEPASGWLVKYSDHAIAYYYDQQTKERIQPWNTFSNSYSKTSIALQAEHAKKLKMYINSLEFGVPICVLVFGTFFFCMRLSSRRVVRLAWACLFIIIIAAAYHFAKLASFPSKKPIVIGISRWVPFGNTAYDDNIQGFKDALTKAGYVEGKDVIYDLEIADADPVKQKEIARSFIAKDVDLVYSLTTPGTTILRDNIINRPIVFSVVTYPVESGLIKSMAHSGNNLVGTRNWVSADTQLSVFRDLVPLVSSIGFIHRTGEVNSSIQLEEMRDAAGSLGINVVEIAGKDLPELKNALYAAQGIDSVFSACDTLVQGQSEEMIIGYAREKRLPSFSCNNSGPRKGDLVGTVADFYQIGNMSGGKAALVLEGATPNSLETNTISRPYIYVNKKTADFLGIKITQSILANAKEIIN